MKTRALLLALALFAVALLGACGDGGGTAAGTATPGGSAAETPGESETEEEGGLLYEEAPSKYEYGVYVNFDTRQGDHIADYSVAYNSAIERGAYVFYSARGLAHVAEELKDADEAYMQALAAAGQAMAIRANAGFLGLDENLLSLEGHAFDSAEKEKFYYVYAAYVASGGVSVEKAGRFITPHAGPEPPAQYGAGEVGAIVPSGGSTSIFKDSSIFVPGYIEALAKGARDAGIETPRVALIETAAGTENDLYNYFYLPDGEWSSDGDALRALGFEPIYIPLGTDNFEEVANARYFADLVKSCHIVLFVGGNQAYYGRALVNADGSPTLIAKAILHVIEHGGTLGGSSAGAHAMSKRIFQDGAVASYQPMYWNGTEAVAIAGYKGETLDALAPLNEGNNLAYDGVGFVEPIAGKNVLFDTHFDARGRFGRLLVALRDTDPAGIAVGMDENTGMRIDGADRVGTVFGWGGVYVIDASNAVWNSAGTIGEFGVTGLVVHYLTAGDRFDFSANTALPGEGKTEIVSPSGAAYASENIFESYETAKTVISLVNSAEASVSLDVVNASTRPFILGNCYTVTFEKTPAAKAYSAREYYAEGGPADALSAFPRTTALSLAVSVSFGPSKFDPNAGGGFEALSAALEANLYATGVTFSGPLSIGFQGNNRYFLDCEQPENFPDDYVEVRDGAGNVKPQDRIYTFRVDNDCTLRIVLADDVFFAEGDVILVKTTVYSIYGVNAASETTFTLTGGQWVKGE